jgi:hypothetical protein
MVSRKPAELRHVVEPMRLDSYLELFTQVWRTNWAMSWIATRRNDPTSWACFNRIASRRSLALCLAELQHPEHLAVVPIELDLPLAGDPDGSAAIKPELSAHVITSEGQLAGLEKLRTLDLGFAKVTDAGMKELSRLKRLQILNLEYTKVTDAACKGLAEIKELRSLNRVLPASVYESF